MMQTSGQTEQSIYRFVTKSQAKVVLTAISKEVNLTESELVQIKELIYSSAAGQEEISKQPGGNTPEVIENTVRRQTMHIEDNLKSILGEATYKQYLLRKSIIEKTIRSANEVKD